MTIEQIHDLYKFNKNPFKVPFIFDTKLDFIFDCRNYILTPSKTTDVNTKIINRNYFIGKIFYENLFEIIDRPEYFIYA